MPDPKTGLMGLLQECNRVATEILDELHPGRKSFKRDDVQNIAASAYLKGLKDGSQIVPQEKP